MLDDADNRDEVGNYLYNLHGDLSIWIPSDLAFSTAFRENYLLHTEELLLHRNVV